MGRNKKDHTDIEKISFPKTILSVPGDEYSGRVTKSGREIYKFTKNIGDEQIKLSRVVYPNGTEVDTKTKKLKWRITSEVKAQAV